MNAISVYHLVDLAQTVRLRGDDNQQNDTGLLYQVPGAGRTPSTGAPIGRGIGLGGFSIHNRSGSTLTAAGIGIRLPNTLWGAGQWVNADATPFTDDTADAQSTTAADVALETTTDNDGFVVHSWYPFSALSIDVVTASVGAGAVRAVRYSNAAGDGWTNFANLFIQDGASGVWATGEGIIAWVPPANWGRTQAAGLSGIPGGRYAINVRQTTAGTGAAVADSLSVYRLYFLQENLADNGLYEWWPGGAEAFMYPADALVALFSTANNQNRVTALVRPRE